jgi:hypothetical protein
MSIHEPIEDKVPRVDNGNYPHEPYQKPCPKCRILDDEANGDNESRYGEDCRGQHTEHD